MAFTTETLADDNKKVIVKEGPQRDMNNLALYIIDLNNMLSNAKVLAKKDPKAKMYIKLLQKDIKDAKQKLAKIKKPIRLKSKSGMGKISHLGMENVIENKQEKLQIAKTILSQLGGNRFVAMTGAKSFGYDSKGSSVSLQFRIGRNAKQVNIVKINYIRGKDLYEMEFYKGTRLLKKVSNVYADQLQKLFTKHTGMYTSL